jgi:hypothetical protein
VELSRRLHRFALATILLRSRSTDFLIGPFRQGHLSDLSPFRLRKTRTFRRSGSLFGSPGTLDPFSFARLDLWPIQLRQ